MDPTTQLIKERTNELTQRGTGIETIVGQLPAAQGMIPSGQEGIPLNVIQTRAIPSSSNENTSTSSRHQISTTNTNVNFTGIGLFAKLYANTLRNPPATEIPKTSLDSLSGVLVLMLSGKSIMEWGTDPEVPIEFIRIIFRLVTQDPPPNWEALFKSNFLQTKKAWKELLGNAKPFNNKAQIEILLNSIAYALTIKERPNQYSNKGWYARKMEFCLNLLVKGISAYLGKKSPILFSAKYCKFWEYVDSPEGLQRFKKSKIWKIPAGWGYDMADDAVDNTWDEILYWLRNNGNGKVIRFKEDLE